jgi:acetyltransferase-like isoleucine patch superfamily enzyme
MKRIIISLIYFFLKLFGGENFSTKLFNPFVLLKFFFWQKILRINSKIPWPVHFTSRIKEPSKIIRGTRNPGMAIGCYIDGRNGIVFGQYVWIGPRVSLISKNHNKNDYTKYISQKSIIIGNDCWIGANAIILPEVNLGNHVIVAAGAVVTKSFIQNNIVIGGNPAKIISQTDEYSK